MRFLEEILYLSSLKGIGRSALNDGFVPWNRWCESLGRPRKAPFRLAEEWLRQTGRKPSKTETEAARKKTQEVLEWLARHENVRVCTVFDDEYPESLAVMRSQRPPVLYISGSAASIDQRFLSDSGIGISVPLSPSLAVIGSRWPGEYTLENGPVFVKKLVSQAGMVIISGLARGCDRMGHLAALDNRIPTIAVMPCGPDTVVPEVNRDLAARITEGQGLLVTEYPPGTPPAEYRYVERDRVTAALSSAAVVVECGMKSGTMQTVKAAQSFGKPVACWYPESAEQYGFEGNRYMIEQMGAFRLRDANSLAEFLEMVKQSEKHRSMFPEQLTLFD